MTAKEPFIRKCLLMYLKKNADYGDSVVESLSKYGIIAYQVRAGDKINRIKVLMRRDAEVLDEKLEDTLQDLFIYSCMATTWNQQNEDNTPDIVNLLGIIVDYVENPEMLIDYLMENDLLSTKNEVDVEAIEVITNYLLES